MVDEDVRFIKIRITMEKRLMGVLLTALGVFGLLLTSFYLIHRKSSGDLSLLPVMIYGILGIVFFFAGIGLIRNSKDLTNRNLTS
jgi:hypothetical protein